MTDAVYPKWKEQIAQGTASASLGGSGTTGVYAALIDLADYTYNASHEFYSSISAAIVGTPVELTGKTFTNGVFDAADTTWAAVSGDGTEAIIFFIKNGGSNSTWRLFHYKDAGSVSVSPSGIDVIAAWNASGIVAL